MVSNAPRFCRDLPYVGQRALDASLIAGLERRRARLLRALAVERVAYWAVALAWIVCSCTLLDRYPPFGALVVALMPMTAVVAFVALLSEVVTPRISPRLVSAVLLVATASFALAKVLDLRLPDGPFVPFVVIAWVFGLALAFSHAISRTRDRAGLMALRADLADGVVDVYRETGLENLRADEWAAMSLEEREDLAHLPVETLEVFPRSRMLNEPSLRRGGFVEDNCSPASSKA